MTKNYDSFRCKKCKEPLNQHLFIALAIMFGARSSSDPRECSMGGKHEYEKIKPMEAKR